MRRSDTKRHHTAAESRGTHRDTSRRDTASPSPRTLPVRATASFAWTLPIPAMLKFIAFSLFCLAIAPDFGLPFALPVNAPLAGRRTSHALSAAPKKKWTEAERNTILSRSGDYWKMDRLRGKVSFGSSSFIRTGLEGADEDSVRRWLADDRSIAMSIWDPKLVSNPEPQVYRLKLMTLMFVTIQLAPSVDVKMYTDDKTGVFKLESVAFEPGIQLLPGIKMSAESLGIVIDVVGELYPSRDGKSVDGKIGFVTSGDLPPPMRMLPEQAFKSSMSTINSTIMKFAQESFQKGARAKFREFLRKESTAAT